MKTSAVAFGLLVALVAIPARATVLLSTIHSPTTVNATRFTWPNYGSSGSVPRGGPIGMSFNVSAASTITDVKLQLSANNPSDGGSVLVFLVPDTGLGGPGTAASPTFTGTGNTLALTGATQIGSILDSALPSIAAGALETFNTSLSVAAGEYWLFAENLGANGISGAAPTAKWVFDSTSYTGGTGTAGQSVFWQAGQSGFPGYGTPATFSDTTLSSVVTNPGTNNLYIAQVDASVGVQTNTPEPMSVALLGVGIGGLGLVRLRRGKPKG